MHFFEDPDLGEVKCHPELICQVVLNLLDNAALATAANKTFQALSTAANKNPYIHVHLSHTIREQKNEIKLMVVDNGIGMDSVMLDKIFIPFYTSSPQGTGLGLSICQKIAEAHEGRIEAQSVFGEGTTMTLRFVSPTA